MLLEKEPICVVEKQWGWEVGAGLLHDNGPTHNLDFFGDKKDQEHFFSIGQKMIEVGP